MAFEKVQSLDCDLTISLGGRNKKTGKANPSSVEGYYLGSREIPDKFSKTGYGKIHVLQTAEGNVGVFGKTDLNRKITAVQPGTMTRITQEGSVPTNKGNDMLLYIVEVDKENTIDVGNFTASDVAPANDGGELEDYSGADESEQEEAPCLNANSKPFTKPSAENQARVQALLSGRARK